MEDVLRHIKAINLGHSQLEISFQSNSISDSIAALYQLKLAHSNLFADIWEFADICEFYQILWRVQISSKTLAQSEASTMFNFKLEEIQKRQAYIDNLSDDQIATIKTKEIFFKAQEELPSIDKFCSDPDSQENTFQTVNVDDPGSSLLKHILFSPQNSYEQIQKIESGMKLFDDPEFNQISQVKKLFNEQKDEIKNSGLKVRDFIDLYESQQLLSKDMNDPLVKKITAFFQTNTKEHDLFDLLSCIMGNLQSSFQQNQVEVKEVSSNKKIRKIRQSVCSFQGLKIQKQESHDQFNDEIKKQMDKIMSYYIGVLQLFKLDDDQ